MVLSELGKIEISIRTQLSLIMSDYAGIYWFANDGNFRDANHHASLLRSLHDELRRSEKRPLQNFAENTQIHILPVG